MRITLIALAFAAATVAAKGGKAAVPVTILFDDVAGDAIQSDGLGAYTGTVSPRTGDFELATGADELFFDFSVAIYPGATPPFQSGLLDGVTMTVYAMDGAPGTSSPVTVRFEFVAPAPDGSGPTDWRLTLWMNLSRSDTDGDGATDTYVLEHPGEYYANLAWLTDPETPSTTGPRRGPPYKDDGWRAGGTFDMVWGATLHR
jgi:hypothetical protein